MRIPTRVLVFAVLVGAGPPAVAQVAPPVLWSDLDPGPYAIGFETLYLEDASRGPLKARDDGSFQGRQIRLLVWYPALPDGFGDPMRFEDYLRPDPPDPRFEAYDEMLAERDLGTARRQFDGALADSLADVLFNTPVAARREASPAPGPFPLVLHSLGRNDYQQESTVLWEHLASHGYIVAVVPQMGRSLHRPGLAFTPADVSLQQQDLAFALAAMVRRPHVDAQRTAAIGHSSGGVAALLLAADNPNVDAVVALDGSATTPDGLDLLADASWRPFDLTAPILDLYAASNPDSDARVLDALPYADVYRVAFAAATHFDFQNWPLYATLTGIPDARAVSLRSSQHGAAVFTMAVRLTRLFLDGILKDDIDALQSVRGEGSLPDVPEGFMTFSWRNASAR